MIELEIKEREIELLNQNLAESKDIVIEYSQRIQILLDQQAQFPKQIEENALLLAQEKRRAAELKENANDENRFLHAEIKSLRQQLQSTSEQDSDTIPATEQYDTAEEIEDEDDEDQMAVMLEEQAAAIEPAEVVLPAPMMVETLTMTEVTPSCIAQSVEESQDADSENSQPQLPDSSPPCTPHQKATVNPTDVSNSAIKTHTVAKPVLRERPPNVQQENPVSQKVASAAAGPTGRKKISQKLGPVQKSSEADACKQQ